VRSAARACVVLVVLAAIFAHARALGHGFVYDDHRFIEHNRALQPPIDVVAYFRDPGTASAAAGVEPDIYRPLRTLSFALDRALFGLEPRGWHAASIAIHAINAALLFVFLLRRLRPPEGAGPRPSPEPGARNALVAATLGSLVFAVHPVTTESVVWISSRGDLLAWTFVLLAFEAFARPGVRATLAGTVLGALACLAKESALVLFALVPIAHVSLPEGDRPSRRVTCVRVAALAAVTAGYLALRGAVLPGSPDLPYLAQTGFPEGGRIGALRGFLASIAWYARNLVWPAGFPFDRNVHTDPVPASFLDPAVLVGAGIVASMLLAAAVAWRRRRFSIVSACLGALAALGPVSSVVVPLKAFAAERFLYPVLPFVALGVGAGVGSLERASPIGRGVGRAVATALAGVLLALAIGRAGPWKSESTLWRAVQADEPMNPRAYEGIGYGHLVEGRVDLAERAFRTYREFQPRDGKVHAELAATFRRLANELVPSSEEAIETTNLVANRRLALEQSILESRAAWNAWSTTGLVRARGDAALVRASLKGWRDAALEFGDLHEAAFVNATLSEDDRVRTGTVAYGQRRCVPLLAALTLVARPSPDAPDKGGSRARVRAELLAAAGVDPAKSDFDAMGEVVGRLSALLAEEPGDVELRRVRMQVLGLRLADEGSSPVRGELEMLRSDLEILVRAYPRDRVLAKALETVRRR